MLDTNKQGPDEGLVKWVDATLSCAFLWGRYWVPDASMQAMQGKGEPMQQRAGLGG